MINIREKLEVLTADKIENRIMKYLTISYPLDHCLR